MKKIRIVLTEEEYEFFQSLTDHYDDMCDGDIRTFILQMAKCGVAALQKESGAFIDNAM